MIREADKETKTAEEKQLMNILFFLWSLNIMTIFLLSFELITADYKGLRDKMKNIQFLSNATIKSTQHFEHDIFIINLTIIIAVHLSVYTL